MLCAPLAEDARDTLFINVFGTKRGSNRPPDDPRALEDFFYSRISDEELLAISTSLPKAPWQRGTPIAEVKLLLAGPRFYLPRAAKPYNYSSLWLGIGPSRSRKKDCQFVLLNIWHDREGNLAPERKVPSPFRQASASLANSLLTARMVFSLDESKTQRLLSPGAGPELVREQVVQAFRQRLETRIAPSSPIE
jgi:hypothetical protein